MHDFMKQALLFGGKCLGRLAIICVGVCLAGIVLALAVGAILPFSSNNNQITDVSTVSSPDGAYQVAFQMRGEPAWPFGPVKVLVTVLEKDGTVVEKLESSIANDGGPAFPANMQVVWQANTVEIILNGEEQEDETHQIQLS